MTTMRVNKLAAARRQLETAITLYFAEGDEVSMATLAGAAYAVLRDINEHRDGEMMLKDLHRILPKDQARKFKRYINSPENFLKHADRDPEEIFEFKPEWTEVLLWEASRKYWEITSEKNRLLIIFVVWFTVREPAVRDWAEANLSPHVFSKAASLPMTDRKGFFRRMNEPS
jgi:hypothetical protein